MPGNVLTPEEREQIRQEKAEIQAAVNLVPPEWKEMASARYTRPRLIVRRLEEAKGEEETDFNELGDMFIVEFPSSIAVHDTGLAYITHYVGFGALQFVLLMNNDANTQMYATKGKIVPNASGREYRFYKINDRNLHANVPHAAAAYPAAVGANPPAALAVNPIGAVDENPSNRSNNVHTPIGNDPTKHVGGRKRARSRKGKKASRKHKNHVRKQKKHTRKH